MLNTAVLEAISHYDVCAIADAVEQFGLRLRNEGFSRPGLRCFTQNEPRLIGYAETFQLRSSDPPTTGGAFLDRTDWWPEEGSEVIPRIAVIQDLDSDPLGVYVGQVHGALFKALGFRGVITDGAVRDLPSLRHMRFPVFARYAGVSRAYIHIVSHGAPVEVFGLKVRSGDLLYADRHGVVNIPLSIATEVAQAASRIRANEASIVQACLSTHLSRAELLDMIQNGQTS